MLAEHIEFAPQREREFFSAIPAAPAVFLLQSVDPAGEPYVTKTENLRRRLERLLSAPADRSKRLNLRERVNAVEYSLTGSDFESGFLLYRVLRAAFPKTYEKRLHLRFAPLVKMHLDNPYPRASVTTRMGRTGKNVYYGPFASRTAAEKFLNDALDFFKMRRCVEDLNPDPKFPGCVYSEMKMCLAPCFKGCTDDQYQSEVVRVEEFLNTRGESLKRELARQRDRASETLAFEEASALHARIEKLAPVLQQLPDSIVRVDRMHAVIVQNSIAPQSVALFRVDAGCLAGPLIFPISDSEHAKSQSMEARIEAALAGFSAKVPGGTQERMEHLAILRRWLYRGTRKGEIFFANPNGELPMRRLVRGIGRVFKGESPEPQSVPAAVPPEPSSQ